MTSWEPSASCRSEAKLSFLGSKDTAISGSPHQAQKASLLRGRHRLHLKHAVFSGAAADAPTTISNSLQIHNPERITHALRRQTKKSRQVAMLRMGGWQRLRPRVQVPRLIVQIKPH